jgi:hypothetical protein
VLKNIALIVTLLTVTTIVLGQALIYVHVPDNYSAHADIKAKSADISVSTDSSICYTAIAFDDARPVGMLYIYYDDDYAVFGTTHAGQWSFISQTVSELRMRGFTDTKIVNAAELAVIVSTYKEGDAILISSGVLPNTVYQTSGADIFKWVADGGSLYWAGYAIGEKVAEGKTVKSVANYQNSIFGKNNVILTDAKTSSVRSSDSNAKMLGEALMITHNNVTYGLRTSGSGALTAALSLGYEYNGFSSLALVAKGNGMICVVGSFDSSARTSLAQVISSGVSERSDLLAMKSGTLVRGSATETLQWGSSHGKVAVHIKMGTPNVVYARTFF